MGYMNYGSSMRYGPSGKRRKTNAWTTKKKAPPPKTELKPDQRTLDRIREAQEFREKYPSYTSTGHKPTKFDDDYKQEVSKNYTVAIGYNKGAYQVIPNNEIKHIGK